MSLFLSRRIYQPGSAGAPALRANGKFFELEDGRPWFGIQTSDFSSVKRALEKEDVRPLLDERRSFGFNELRQWLLNESVVGKVYPGGISPKQYDPDYFYGTCREHWELCGSYGFAVEVTVFTSCIPMMEDVNDQLLHWQRTKQAAAGLKHVRLELVNEYNWGQGQNAPDRSLWNMPPSSGIASSGSSTADAPPSEPVWGYVIYHSNDLDQWQRKVGHNVMEWADHYQKPGASNENTRPDNDPNAYHFYDAAAGAALLCASACFHSQSGKYSTLFDQRDGDYAKQWVAGAKSVPLDFQRGQYFHRDDLENHVDKTILRAYEKRLSDGRSCIVKIRY